MSGMAPYTLLLFCAFIHHALFWPPTIFFQPWALTLTSEETLPGAGSQMTISCYELQQQNGIKLIWSLYKVSATGSRVLLAQNVEGPRPKGTNGEVQIAPGVTGVTTPHPQSLKGIVLTFSHASCDSAGMYVCIMETFSQTVQTSSNFTVNVSPGHVSLTLEGTPSEGSGFTVGDLVTFTCNADVGTVEGDKQVNITWEYEVSNGSGKTFQTYPNPQDIDNEAAPTLNLYCPKAQTRISRLVRVLTIEDNERQYRCYVTKDGQAYIPLAGYLTFAAVKDVSGQTMTPKISFSPPSLLMTSSATRLVTGRQLTLTCTQPPGTGSLAALSLYKISAGGSMVSLARASLGPPPDGTNGSIQLAPGVTTAGLTVVGGLDQRALTLTYSRASCESAGTYTCSSFALVAGQPLVLQSSAKYTVSVSPGPTVVSYESAGRKQYTVGHVVTFKCVVDVGTVDTNTQVELIWEYEVTNIFGTKTFQRYPRSDDIDSTAAPTPNQYCPNALHRTSRLVRTLTMEDSQRQYRCYPIKNGASYTGSAGYTRLAEVRDVSGQSMSPRLSFNPPSPMALTGDEALPGSGRQLSVTCTQPAGAGSLYSLTLYRLSGSGARTRLAHTGAGAPPDGTDGSAQVAAGVTGATASGGLAQRTLTLTYSHAACDGDGVYVCSSVVVGSGESRALESSATYTVIVGPGRPWLRHERPKNGATSYLINEDIIFTCRVYVGTVEANTQVNFVWEYEASHPLFSAKVFQTYPIPGDVDNTAPPTSMVYCPKSQTRVSRLRRRLTVEDSHRKYRCYITKDGVSYVDYAATEHFEVMNPDG